MFKNLTVYRFPAAWCPEIDDVERLFQRHGLKFVECSPSQDLSIGFVPPRGEDHGAMVESVAGQRILKLMIETKTVPASAIQKHAKAAAQRIEAETGRKPGRKAAKDLKEEALLALLPQAFPKQSAVTIWIDHENNWLAIDAGSQSDIDHTVTALVNVFNVRLDALSTNTSPMAAMSCWLQAPDSVPEDFAVERETELKALDESKATVKFKNHCLNTDEVRQHIAEGKIPTHLAMSWSDRVAFTLTDGLQLKKIEFLDAAIEGRGQDGAEEFDTDVTIATGELRLMIPALIAALGGEFVQEGGAV